MGTDAGFAVPNWLRVVLIVAALSELIGGLQALPILAGNLNETPGPGFGGWVIITYIVLRPVFALAALFLLIKRRFAEAIMSLCAVAVLAWANMMPSVVGQGLNLGDGDAITRSGLIFTIFVVPVVAVIAAALASRRTRPVLAGLLAVTPTVVGWLGVLLFAGAIATHGF